MVLLVLLFTLLIGLIVALNCALHRWRRERALRALAGSFVAALTEGDYQAADEHATAWFRTAGQGRKPPPPPPYRWPSVPGGWL